MKKFTRLPILIEVKEYTTQKVLKIDFGTHSITDWCLSLCLLKENLIESLVISNDTFRLELLKDNRIPESERAQMEWNSEPKKLRLTQTELDYWIAFFLQYYRDGVAAVDHLDVEISPAHPREKEIGITIKVANVSPPLSEKEIRQRLGLKEKKRCSGRPCLDENRNA